MRDEAGRQALAIVITRDLTAQTRAEKALRESQGRYQTLFESIDDGFCLMQLLYDAHGEPVDYRFLETNAAYETHTGLRNTVGRTVGELFPVINKSWLQRYAEVARTGGSIRFEDHTPSVDRWLEVYATRAGEPGSHQVAIVLKNITERKRAEQALRESEARAYQAAARAEAESRLLDAVLEAAPAGIVVADASGQLVRMNPANERLWGTAPRSSSMEEYREWKGWWADGSERHGRRLEPHELGHGPGPGRELVSSDIVEIEPFDAPGTRRTMLNSAAPVRDGAGQILGGVVAQMDITARVEAEAAVRRSEERYRLVGRATNDVIWDWELATDRLDWNDAVREHFGCTREELGPTIDGWYSRIHPEDLERVVAGIHVAIDGTQDDLGRRVPLPQERRLLRRHPRPWAYRPGASGRAVRMIGSMLDLTERHQAEAALRESKERFDARRRHLAACLDGGRDGWIFWYNQRWFDYTAPHRRR